MVKQAMYETVITVSDIKRQRLVDPEAVDLWLACPLYGWLTGLSWLN